VTKGTARVVEYERLTKYFYGNLIPHVLYNIGYTYINLYDKLKVIGQLNREYSPFEVI